MNLSPKSLQSVVTKNKNLVEVGTHLYCGVSSEFFTVDERNGDMVLLNAEDDTNHEFDNWFDLNDLQTSFQFARSDNWKNEENATQITLQGRQHKNIGGLWHFYYPLANGEKWHYVKNYAIRAELKQLETAMG